MWDCGVGAYLSDSPRTGPRPVRGIANGSGYSPMSMWVQSHTARTSLCWKTYKCFTERVGRPDRVTNYKTAFVGHHVLHVGVSYSVSNTFPGNPTFLSIFSYIHRQVRHVGRTKKGKDLQ